jgi:hypothetical protein
MWSSVTILDQWLEPEDISQSTQGARNDAITVAACPNMLHIE